MTLSICSCRYSYTLTVLTLVTLVVHRLNWVSKHIKIKTLETCHPYFPLHQLLIDQFPCSEAYLNITLAITMYITDNIKYCKPVCTYSGQDLEEASDFGGGVFYLRFFGGLLHSPLGNFWSLRCSLYPSLQVGTLQLLLLLGGWSSESVLLLCWGNLIDNNCGLPIPRIWSNFKCEDKIWSFNDFQTTIWTIFHQFEI